MFTAKKKSLIKQPVQASTTSIANPFVSASLKKSARTTKLGNNAVKYTTTGNDFVDQFGKISQYKIPRSYADVSKDMSILWAINPNACVRLALYIRMITRQTDLWDGNKTEHVQRGQGLKHEGIMRMLWIAINHPKAFTDNIYLFIATGSWKDIIQMMSYDIQYHGWDGRCLDWKFLGSVICAGLENKNTSELVKKYLPQIRTNSVCKTLEAQADNIIAKYICSLIFNADMNSYKHYARYRKLKASGTAHQWQQVISRGQCLNINFNTVHGRALAQLVSSKFLKNQGLEERYEKWLASKPVAKFTGYPYELFKPLGMNHRINSLKQYQIETINKQFLGLVETAKKGMKAENGLIVVIDTSGSMTSEATGCKGISAYTVAKSMALFFSYLLDGPFKDAYLEFSKDTILKMWKGKTPVEKYANETSSVIANTNFQSIADHFGKILGKGVKEKDFPTGILCVSDGCFDQAGKGSNRTNFNTLKDRLRNYGFSKDFVDNFKVILWDIPNNYYHGKVQTAFEDFANTPNLYYMAGFDPAAIAFITGTEEKKGMPTPKNAEELFEAAMDQEILHLVNA